MTTAKASPSRLVRLASATVLASLAVTASVGTAAAAPAYPIPTVTGSGLSGSSLQDMLLTDREASRALGVSLDEIATGSQLDSTRVSPARCAGAYTPGAAYDYADANPQDLAVKVVSDRDGTSVTEIVAELPTKKDALNHMAATADGWSDCQGQTVTASGKPWILGAPMVNDARTMVTLSQTFAGRGRGTCERAIATYRNIVIDVMTCSSAASGQGAAITQAIADKANSQPV
ncbi:sensor domain-containing protein [Mycolicibacterium sp. P1-18]|uniref:sensor domain-containing protein n=1 Tax=Mycolicibacterium sp. P1-18 TaxID=2024615 RepID=UPI0015646782|nr:sensor domain-containing protein [Mycolicibacterium sp. P1-18]